MAELNRDKKVNLRQIMDEISEDEAFTDEERELAKKKAMELDYLEWCAQQIK